MPASDPVAAAGHGLDDRRLAELAVIERRLTRRVIEVY
jgi:hypothetical protein